MAVTRSASPYPLFRCLTLTSSETARCTSSASIVSGTSVSPARAVSASDFSSTSTSKGNSPLALARRTARRISAIAPIAGPPAHCAHRPGGLWEGPWPVGAVDG